MIVVLNARGPQRELRLPVTEGTWRDVAGTRTYTAGDSGVLIDEVPAGDAILLTRKESPKVEPGR
jgi:hypothetical protein